MEESEGESGRSQARFCQPARASSHHVAANRAASLLGEVRGLAGLQGIVPFPHREGSFNFGRHATALPEGENFQKKRIFSALGKFCRATMKILDS